MTDEVKAPEIDRRSSTKKLLKGGVILSASWLLLAGALLFWKRGEFSTLHLNEWGDFLAGVSAPLALLWLVLGYFQQGVELRQNTTALELQYEELKRQVAETAELAKSAGRQADAYEGLYQLTRHSAARDAQPIFAAQTIHAGQNFAEVTLVNHGAIATNVSVIAADNRVQIRDPEAWPRGEGKMLTVSGVPPLPVTFQIAFTDALGALESQYFTCDKATGLKRLR